MRWQQLRLVPGVMMMLVTCAFSQQDPPPFTVGTALKNVADAPPNNIAAVSSAPTITQTYHDARGRVVVTGDTHGTYGLRYDQLQPDFSEFVDTFGNRTRVTMPGSLPIEFKHEFVGAPAWYERLKADAAGKLLLFSVDEGESTLPAKAAQFGLQVGFPDWVQVAFRQATSINEIHIVTLQDDYAHGIKPLLASDPGGPTQFSWFGITDYEVQYLNASGKWIAVPGGYVTNNRDVARALIFAPITTTAIRLVVKAGLQSYSRVVEVEAFEQGTHRNVALASQGGSATASSTYSAGFPASSVIDGDETGRLWANGGGWNDATPDVPAPAASVQQNPPDGNNFVQSSFSNAFATVNRTTNLAAPPTATPQLGLPFMLERTIVTFNGHEFDAGVYLTNNGIEYWDSSGGSRIQYYDWNKQLYFVTDGTGPLLRINRDSLGRPKDVYLGKNVGLLEFTYDAQGWVVTRLLDRVTNQTRFSVSRHDNHQPGHYPELLPRSFGYLPGFGPIVEWNDGISSTGNIISALKDHPYALLAPNLPYQPGWAVLPVRWVIEPFSDQPDPMLNIRVEYDDTTLYVYVPTGNSGGLAIGRDQVVFRFKRASASSSLAKKFNRQRPLLVQAALSMVMDGGCATDDCIDVQTTSDGGDDGGGGGCSTDDCITVTAQGDPPVNTLPEPQPFPPPDPPPPDPNPPNNVNPCDPSGGAAGPKAAVECKDPTDSEQHKLDKAKPIASTALKDSRCNAFLKDPSKALKTAGYNGNAGGVALDHTRVLDDWWAKESYHDGGSQIFGFDPHGQPLVPCNVPGTSAFTHPLDWNVYLCPLYGTDSSHSSYPGGDAGWAAGVLLHEFLHTLGLNESNNFSGQSGYPTSAQITSAVQAECGPAIAAAVAANP